MFSQPRSRQEFPGEHWARGYHIHILRLGLQLVPTKAGWQTVSSHLPKTQGKSPIKFQVHLIVSVTQVLTVTPGHGQPHPPGTSWQVQPLFPSTEKRAPPPISGKIWPHYAFRLPRDNHRKLGRGAEVFQMRKRMWALGREGWSCVIRENISLFCLKEKKSKPKKTNSVTTEGSKWNHSVPVPKDSKQSYSLSLLAFWGQAWSLSLLTGSRSMPTQPLGRPGHV